MIKELLGVKPDGTKELVTLDLDIAVLSNVDCELDTYVGAAVYMQSSGIAANAIATSLSTSNVIGIIDSKSSPTKCVIRVMGVTGEHYSGLDVALEYYLSDVTPGLITTTVPNTTGHVRLKLGQPFSDKKFLVMKGERTVRG